MEHQEDRDDRETRERVARLDRLLAELESLDDPRSRALAVDAVTALLDVYGEGLARITAAVAAQGGEEAVRTLARDDLVSHLFLLHGLHPVPLEERVARALEEVRPSLRKRGVAVEFLGVAAGRARLRVENAQAGCQSCAASASLPEHMIEEALLRYAPDLAGVDLLDQAPTSGLIPVSLVARRARTAAPSTTPTPSSSTATSTAR